MKYLIVGLGNVGSEYANTRHNAGFIVVDALATKHAALFTENRYGYVTEIKLKGQTLIVLKPNTFMNLSGNAVRYWMQKEKIDLERLLVVVDDLALPFGTLRMKGRGSSAGHNGLRNIEEMLGTDAYARLRFGLGSDFPRGGQIDYVLSQFPAEQQETLRVRSETACEMIESFCLSGLSNTMNQYNNK
ncbi:MAG: aminoacyl-tRNA hydrolase [Paludibacteraceae bacterium]|nr:aminoacyl-tRNA hydrolase [Paludibacteraceae bacterium]